MIYKAPKSQKESGRMIIACCFTYPLFSGPGYSIVSCKFLPWRPLLSWQPTVFIQRLNWLQAHKIVKRWNAASRLYSVTMGQISRSSERISSFSNDAWYNLMWCDVTFVRVDILHRRSLRTNVVVWCKAGKTSWRTALPAITAGVSSMPPNNTRKPPPTDHHPFSLHLDLLTFHIISILSTWYTRLITLPFTVLSCSLQKSKFHLVWLVTDLLYNITRRQLCNKSSVEVGNLQEIHNIWFFYYYMMMPYSLLYSLLDV